MHTEFVHVRTNVCVSACVRTCVFVHMCTCVGVCSCLHLHASLGACARAHAMLESSCDGEHSSGICHLSSRHFVRGWKARCT